MQSKQRRQSQMLELRKMQHNRDMSIYRGGLSSKIQHSNKNCHGNYGSVWVDLSLQGMKKVTVTVTLMVKNLMCHLEKHSK